MAQRATPPRRHARQQQRRRAQMRDATPCRRAALRRFATIFHFRRRRHALLLTP